MPKAARYHLRWVDEQGIYTMYETSHSELPLSDPVGSPEWVFWLSSIPSFTFTGKRGSITVRQEARGGTGTYWYAYRRHGRKMHKLYLGRAADLTPAHLEEIAFHLATPTTSSSTQKLKSSGSWQEQSRDPQPSLSTAKSISPQETAAVSAPIQADKQAREHKPNLLLKRARLARGWSQQEVADQIDAPYAFMVNRWENGVVFPGPGYRKKLCALFGKSLEELGLTRPEHLPLEKHAEFGIPGPIYDSAAPHYLTGQQRLIGRDTLLADIKACLQNHSSRKVALYGLPGVGKTTLAAALCNDPQLREIFPDGVLWAEPGLHSDLTTNLSRWSTLLGISPARTVLFKNTDEWVRALRDAIGMKRMLFVIDDAWTIEEALSQVVGGPRCSYLLTTRLPEVAARFAGQEVFQVNELGQVEGIELLLDVAPLLQETSADVLRRLIQATGGLPLALKLMGNHLMLQARHHQPRRLQAALERLQHAQARLQLAEPQAGIERDRRLPTGTPLTLQAVIELSERLLTQTQRQALTALSLFPPRPHTFSEEAALEITATSPDVLDSLVESGLVEVSEQGRYHLHQTIVDYAQSRCTSQQARHRLVRYIARYIEQHQDENTLLEQEDHVIFTALDTARKISEHEVYLQMLLNLIPFFETTRPATITQQYLHHAYIYAKAEDYHGYALRIAFHLGNILREQSNLTEAEAILREGLSLRTLQDNSESIDLLSALALVRWEQNRFSEALSTISEAIARAEPLGNQSQLSNLYCTRGILALFAENVDEAEHFFFKAYELERANQTSRMRAIAMINLGETCGTKGNFSLGQHFMQEAFQIADACTYRDLLSPLHQSLGVLAACQGEYDSAQRLLVQALEEATSQNLQRRRGYIFVDFSLVFLKLGDVAQAQAALQEVSALIQRDDLLKVLLLLAQGRVALEQRDLAQASEIFQEALAQSHSAHQSLWHRCEALLYLGITMQRTGDLQRAQAYLQEGSALAQTLRRPQLRGEIQLAWGEHFLLRKDYQQAEEHFSQIIESIPHGFHALIAEAHAGLAFAAAGLQRFQEARHQGETALALFEKMQHARQKELRDFVHGLSVYR